jgi:hypothetical protein
MTMKTLTTMTAVAALIAGMSIAGAQTNDGKTANPGSINAAPTTEGNTGKSGMQPKATQDMKGSSMKGASQTMPNKQVQSENPASINEKPTGSGSAAQSGAQPPATANMPARTAPSATTGTSASQPTIDPAAPNAKPTDNAGGTGGNQ